MEKFKTILIIVFFAIIIFLSFTIYQYQNCECEYYRNQWITDDLGEEYYDMTWLKTDSCHCPCQHWFEHK